MSEAVSNDDPGGEGGAPPETVRTPGRGMLRGQIALSPDWDSDLTNESIVREFGTQP